MYLKILAVTVVGTNSEKRIFALLDEGSAATLINSKVIDEIGAVRTRYNTALRGVGSSDPVFIATEKINISIIGEFETFKMTGVLVVNDLALPEQRISENVTELCYQKTGIKPKSYSAVPDLLIGQDNINLILTRESHIIFEGTFFNSRCSLGWTIHGYRAINYAGTYTNVVNKSTENNTKHKISRDDELDKVLKTYFDIESIGIVNGQKYSTVDERALRILEETSSYIGNAWEVGLLWKSDDKKLPKSRITAYRRLLLLEKRLDRDKYYAEKYYREMDRLIQNGFAQKMPNNSESDRVWFLPHFGVQNINKPGKVRLVFDAAAKSAGISLNDMLLAGPNLLNSLPGVIMRFRQHAFAFKGDMKDMFLKIKLNKNDCNAQRFLWRGKERVGEPSEYVMTTVLFGAKSSPCTALYIKDKNAAQFKSMFPSTVESLINNCYMDDYLDSCESEKEAEARVTQATIINANAGWQMHSWASNSSSILKGVNISDETTQLVKVDTNINSGEKILGLKWLNLTDELSFNVNIRKLSSDLCCGLKRPTKREFLSVTMSIFDPLGFLAPFTIKSRILLQKICRSGIKWDEEIHDTEFVLWKQWLIELKTVIECRIERCYQLKNVTIKSIELHIFGDASIQAYAAVAYWRFALSNGQYHVSMIIGKSRVAPLAVQTIPRLELQAAVVVVRLGKLIEKEHTFVISKKVYWSDSKSVLYWIKRDPREYKIFVANRLAEIRESSNECEWQWISTRENPADDATRDSVNPLNSDSRWFHGPSFLRKDESLWPKTDFNIENNSEELKFELKESVPIYHVINVPPEIDFSRFSSWTRLISTIAHVLKVIDNWKKRIHTPEELIIRAEETCLKTSQLNSFAKEISALRRGESIPKDSRILNLNAVLDEHGMLRSNSRISNFRNEEISSKPLILDAKETAVQLLINHFHNKYYHASHESVINELQQTYWIVGIRRGLRNLVAKCIICKIQRGRPSNPKMSALPKARLAYYERPFTHCGIDYFGPITVSIGRRREKRWGALFTCMTTRAIHVELAHTLSTDSAIMALRRFAARRGTPSYVYCDNGTNFRGMSAELARVMNDIDRKKIQEYASKQKITWKFNPPSASHMGGAWERLIRSVKTALAVVLREQAPKEETLLTILAEVEHAVNSRPLTHVPVDPRDQEALTPNHFLLGTSSGQIKINKYKIQKTCPKKQWLIAQKFADDFWQRWLREYLPSLIPRKKWFENNDSVKLNDIVLILDDNLERNQWRKGVVTRVLPGADGQIRVAEVKTANGLLLRPTRKLIKFAE